MDTSPIGSFFRRQSRSAMVVYALLLVILIGIGDYLTGYEVAFFPFYSIPILLLVWADDMSMAVAVSILSALAWWTADTASGHVYTKEWLRVWDTIVRLMFFGLVVAAGRGLSKYRDAHRAQIAYLERTARLEQQIVQISEEAQERVGHDLHDGLCQYLACVCLSAASLKSALAQEGSVNLRAASELADSVEESVVQARGLAHGLSPVDHAEGGLELALDRLADSTQTLSSIPCHFIGDDLEPPLAPEVAVNLFRIAQEAVNNAVRHSRTDSISIALEARDDSLHLRVSDCGAGLKAEGATRSGMGLHIMQYRARLIGASLEFLPNESTGTVVSCIVPLPTNHAATSPCPTLKSASS